MPGVQVNRARVWISALWCGAAISALTGGAAWAQAAPAPAAQGGNATTLSEVVVTGTQMRGVAPAGAEVLGVKQEQIQAIGAPTTNQLLSNVPQIANQFNQLPVLGTTTVSQIQVTRLNLRDLPGLGVQSGNSTLLLVDGHRIASAGVNQFAPDADVVPPGILERVEIVPDGGSSIYGSDAVGGVINLITKRRMSGVHVDVRGGFAAGGYNTINTDLSAGKSWDSGSAYIDWNFAHNTTLLASKRDYPRNIDWNTGIPIGRQCTPANVTTGGVNYAYPALQPNTVNACDRARAGSLFPEQKRNSIFAGVSQDLSDAVKLDLRAFFTQRNTDSDTGRVEASTNIAGGNPFYIQIPGTALGATQNVQFQFPQHGADTSRLKEWGVTPSITADLGHRWQVRGLLNFGGSHSEFRSQSTNPTLLGQYAAGTTTQTAINPYNIGATPNQQLLANILDFRQAGESFVNMTNLRAVADGPVFTLPGGDVHLAVGAEYLRNHLRTRNAGAGLSEAAFEATPFQSYTQAVKSVFGELQVPIVGPGNAVPGVQALNISASVRYDSYNDFGNTTNPKIGVTYQPVDWITLRGSWGKSFNAPTPVDQLGSLANTLLVVPAFFVLPPGQTPGPSDVLVALQGSRQNLQPQTAKQYAVGGDFRWPFLKGLRSSLTYYHIDYDGLLGKPPVFLPGVFFANFPDFYVIKPTDPQLIAFASQAKGGVAQIQQYLGNVPAKAFTLIDFRTANLGSAVTRGLDFSTQYRRDTDYGGWDLSLNGNVEFENNQQLGPGLPVTDNLKNGTALRLQVVAGVDYENLRAQLTMNHNASYNVIPAVNLPQDSVGSFETVNLFFRYALKGEDWRKDLSFTMNVDNLFDAEPPIYKASSSNGTANGSTLGRLVQFGVHKDF